MRNHSRRRSLALLVSLVLLLTGCALHKHLAQAEEAAYIDESAQELMIVDSAEDEAPWDRVKEQLNPCVWPRACGTSSCWASTAGRERARAGPTR